MPSRRILLVLAGLAVLTQPVVGNGPGPDIDYTYEVTPVTLDDDESVAVLYEHPEVLYGTGGQVDFARDAVNETVVRPSTVTDSLRTLTDTPYLADDVNDQYYRVDARITDGQFRLDTTPVSAREVASALAIDRSDAPPAITQALDGKTTVQRATNATLVTDGEEYTMVYVGDTESNPDPLAVLKVFAYALAIVAIVLGLTGRD